MKCPACPNELTEFELGGVTLDACQGGCGGIWFDAFELKRVDEQHEVEDKHLPRIQRDPKLVVDQVRKRDCPRCDGVKLKRHFFSAHKRVEVDHCPSCGGYWLDDGELEKIRDEKHVTAKLAPTKEPGLSMEAIRFLYRQKLEL